MLFPKAFLEHHCRVYSDHNPIVLRFKGHPPPKGERPFRFEAIWSSHLDFLIGGGGFMAW